MKYNIFNLLNESREENMKNSDKKVKTFLVREIPAEQWEQFKIKAIQKDTTCNKAMLELIDRYSRGLVR